MNRIRAENELLKARTYAQEEELTKVKEENEVLKTDNDQLKDAASFYTSTKLALEYKIKS